MAGKPIPSQNLADKSAPRKVLNSSGAKRQGIYKTAIVLGLLLAGFLIIESFIPLRTAVQIGADEGFELAKATLCLKGHRLYTEVWNDQPPFHTFLVTEILRHISPSILGPRLLTVGFSLVLLAAIFTIVFRVNGVLVAALVTSMTIASPGFLELSSSCMLEIPALAAAVAGLSLLLFPRRSNGFLTEIVSGAMFGLALQIKLVPAIYTSLAALVIFLQQRGTLSPFKNTIARLGVMGVSLVSVYFGTDLLIERGAYLSHFQQSWASHFAATKSFEYGSASDHPFEWSILLKNWDVTIPSLVGIAVLARGTRPGSLWALPLVWLSLTFAVFGIHKPWWAYYYLHTAIPLCWCAGIGIEFLVHRVLRRPLFLAMAAMAGVCILCWMGARLYFQVANLRALPKTYSSPVIAQMERFKPFTKWLFADKLVYSFHAGIPIVPSLAVVPIKRMWSGDLTNAKMIEELEKYRPGLIVLQNDGREAPFKDLLQASYQIVYMDKDNRLYADRSIAKNRKRQ